VFPLIFACFRTGVIPIMTLPAHRESEMAHFASLSGALAYVVPGSGRFDYVALARTVCQRVSSIQRVIVDDIDRAPRHHSHFRRAHDSSPLDRVRGTPRRESVDSPRTAGRWSTAGGRSRA